MSKHPTWIRELAKTTVWPMLVLAIVEGWRGGDTGELAQAHTATYTTL